MILRFQRASGYQFGACGSGLIAARGLFCQHVGEEEDLQDTENYYQLDNYDKPQLSSDGHVTETVAVKAEYSSG